MLTPFSNSVSRDGMFEKQNKGDHPFVDLPDPAVCLYRKEIRHSSLTSDLMHYTIQTWIILHFKLLDSSGHTIGKQTRNMSNSQSNRNHAVKIFVPFGTKLYRSLLLKTDILLDSVCHGPISHADHLPFSVVVVQHQAVRIGLTGKVMFTFS